MAAALTRGEVPVSPDVSTAGYRIRFKTEIFEEAADDIPEAILETIQVCPSNDFIIPEEALNGRNQFFVAVGVSSSDVPIAAEVTNDCGAVATVTSSGDTNMLVVLVALTNPEHKDIEITLVVGMQQNPGDDQPK